MLNIFILIGKSLLETIYVFMLTSIILYYIYIKNKYDFNMQLKDIVKKYKKLVIFFCGLPIIFFILLNMNLTKYNSFIVNLGMPVLYSVFVFIICLIILNKISNIKLYDTSIYIYIYVYIYLYMLNTSSLDITKTETNLIFVFFGFSLVPLFILHTLVQLYLIDYKQKK